MSEEIFAKAAAAIQAHRAAEMQHVEDVKGWKRRIEGEWMATLRRLVVSANSKFVEFGLKFEDVRLVVADTPVNEIEIPYVFTRGATKVGALTIRVLDDGVAVVAVNDSDLDWKPRDVQVMDANLENSLAGVLASCATALTTQQSQTRSARARPISFRPRGR